MFDLENIRDSTLFKNIPKADFDAICRDLRPYVKMYSEDEIILIQGDAIDKIGIIAAGRVFSVKYHYDGTSQILQTFRTNDIVGLEAVSSTFVTSPSMLIAGTDCTLVIFRYADFFTAPVISDSSRIILLQNMTKILSDAYIKIMYKVDVLSKRTIRERITTHLSIISEKRNARTFDLGMTQDQFAQYLCINRSTLSKELNEMRRDGLIDFSGSRYTIYSVGTDD